jgi:hypothetical protein
MHDRASRLAVAQGKVRIVHMTEEDFWADCFGV